MPISQSSPAAARTVASGNGRSPRHQEAALDRPAKQHPPSPHRVIDCDIHNEVSSIKDLIPYLADYWRDYISNSAFTGPGTNDYPPGAPTSARPGSAPPFPVGSTPAASRPPAWK